MVALTPEQQFNFIGAYPAVFVPVKGAWGLKGATSVRLAKATAAALRPAMQMAWENAKTVKTRTAKPGKRP
jgi:hypothetical protein